MVKVSEEDCDRSVITMETDEERDVLSTRAVSDFAKLFGGENSEGRKSIRNRTRSGSGDKRRPLLSQ